MRRHAVVLGLTFLGLAAFAVFAGWAVFNISETNDGGRSLGPLWPYIVGGVLVFAALAAVVMWLAFYSAGHDWDERNRRR